jgi:hypothetical protein
MVLAGDVADGAARADEVEVFAVTAGDLLNLHDRYPYYKPSVS